MATAKSFERSKARNGKIKEYFATRRAKKDAERERKYVNACESAHKRGLPTPPRPAYKAPPDDWTLFIKDPELREMLSGARTMSYNARRRRRYEHTNWLAAGRPTEKFIEEFRRADGSLSTAFRTALNITSFELFNSALSKHGTDYGHDKTTVYSQNLTSQTPTSVRDMEYLYVDGMRRCLFVGDLDGWWVDLDSLLADLRRFLPPEFMPNLAAYRGHKTMGGVENPHLIWLLPPGARVIREKGKNKDKQFNLHCMIQRAIVNHLIDIGADPGHTNVGKMKNPLSPKWSVAAQDEFFPTMDDWRRFLPTITPDLREMKTRAKKVKAARTASSPAEVKLSNAIWTDGLEARGIMIRAAQRTQDPTFVKAIKTHAGFVSWLYHPVTGVITRRLIHLHGDTAAVRSVLHAQRELVEELKDTPTAIGQFCDRGRDRERNLMAERDDPFDYSWPKEIKDEIKKKRQRAAGTRSRWSVRDKNRGLIAEEIERRLATGATIDEVIAAKADVVRTLDSSGLVARSTAYRLFDYVADVVSEAARYQAVPAVSILPIDSHPSVDHQPSDQQLESGATEISSEPSVTAMPVDHSVKNPVVRPSKRIISPAEAVRIRKAWREAVVAWRESQLPVPDTGGLVELDLTDTDDPIVCAVLKMRRYTSSRRSGYWH
ncbi:MAG: hypothetical protein J0H40_19320 [Rhizobiales bacterium]|nr:hypothetical protein [Hyphomicrobiales bacterium]